MVTTTGFLCLLERMESLIILARPFLPCSTCGVKYGKYPSSLNKSLLSVCSFMRVSWKRAMSTSSFLIEFKIVLIWRLHSSNVIFLKMYYVYLF